jgi:hypothetical protein
MAPLRPDAGVQIVSDRVDGSAVSGAVGLDRVASCVAVGVRVVVMRAPLCIRRGARGRRASAARSALRAEGALEPVKKFVSDAATCFDG